MRAKINIFIIARAAPSKEKSRERRPLRKPDVELYDAIQEFFIFKGGIAILKVNALIALEVFDNIALAVYGPALIVKRDGLLSSGKIERKKYKRNAAKHESG